MRVRDILIFSQMLLVQTALEECFYYIISNANDQQYYSGFRHCIGDGRPCT
ncbi:hypothetical protein O6H91_12G010100 [Diphasiastrum complanatum]|uniref:Uncharacterized protein n=1 Tax=Diphasiastrum complanatum TaxID=34168 RepID=A0ACC2BYV9_DIPCM|nr:hypothetical protein O6H91_Y362900 [Diphasiastrum complanatum]KAJ7534921.1 hypothetical protein O6H91_12G010100 [Diphasiastrum complanatum]